MKHFAVWLECSHCKGVEFTATLRRSASSEESLRTECTMSHPGLGWSLDTFDVRCAKCRSPMKVRIEEVTHGR